MNALTQSETMLAAPPVSPVLPVLRTLVLCDLADSTAFVERLGDRRAAELMRRHDRDTRLLLQAHGGREIDKTDGFLAIFERPIPAVAFALDYQRLLRRLNDEERCVLAARVGIHLGDVLTWSNAPEDVAKGAKPVEVEGLVKPIASRLMQLALPNQVLLSGVAYSLAHRAQGELGERLATVRWRAHGRYRFKGVPDSIPVFEVGEEGHAPLKPPPWSGKAHREVPFWRRPAMVAVELAALLALLVVPAWYMLRPAPAIAFANRDWVVVGDLKNLTGETKFDESLQTAFRLGLEQSRYVNVLSDLKARETVKLMRRDPESTPIDRAIGSEIAIRDGARALVLLTVAEIGGHVRVTAEVIDPKTQATVYSESADGIGENSILPSLDRVNRQLRVRLGEALSATSNESQPLERVTTKNLDALRAYSLGLNAYGRRDMEEATQMFQHALKLDPEFALARVSLGRIWTSLGRSADAVREFDAAMALRKNLTPRDALFVEAMRATFDEPKPALAKWKMLATIYPDFFPGRGAYAYFHWQQANNYAEATENAKVAASTRNAHRMPSQYLLGALYLGEERYEDALRQFSEVSAIEGTPVMLHAATYAAQRKFDLVESTLALRKMPADDPDLAKFHAAFAVDRGHRKEARDILSRARSQPGIAPRAKFMLELADFSLATLDGKSAALSRMGREVLATARSLPSASLGEDVGQQRFCILALAYLAARVDDLELAHAALATAGPAAGDASYPVVADMAGVARAEIARAERRPSDAVAALTKRNDGTELYSAHVALMDAYAADGQAAKALGESHWLATHRGRAYAEFGVEWVMTPFNVAQSDLALPRGAEIARASGQPDLARQLLEQFAKAWPDANELPLAASAKAGKSD